MTSRESTISDSNSVLRSDNGILYRHWASKEALFLFMTVKKFDKSLQGKKKNVPLQSQFERNSYEAQE